MKTLLRLSFSVVLTVMLILLLFEGLYRWQIIDTYSPELRAFNQPHQLLSDGRPTILMMGDSFTAGRASYPAILQQSFPHVRIINAAVSGTGIIQTLLMAPERFRAFEPSMVLYQIYVGNDLFDITYPVNWNEVSFPRNVYWLLANHLRSIGYINYRIAQAAQPADETRSSTPIAQTDSSVFSNEVFSVDHYEGRVKIYLKADPTLLEDSILVTGHRRTDYGTFLDTLERLIAYCNPEHCRAYLLVIPHVSQVDERYLAYMQQLGARYTEPDRVLAIDYPFIAGIREQFRVWSHVHVLNPLPALRTAGHRTPVYFANNEHLNPAGQEALANYLADQLQLRSAKR